MIVLDTNVVSEMMKPEPSSVVISWLDSKLVIDLFVTTTTIAEITYGLDILSPGKRRTSLRNAFSKVIAEAFAHRILTFDETAATKYGVVMGNRKRLGRPMSLPDGQIAAVALTHDAVLATRNIRDFENCGLKLINPFDHTPLTQQRLCRNCPKSKR